VLSGLVPESIPIEAIMMTAVRIPLFAVLLAWQTSADLPEHFFDVPQGPLACRPIAITSADSAASLLEFIDGDARPRETLAAYDSAGIPLYMTVHLTDQSSTSAVSHNVAVRFSLGGVYVRVERAVKDGAVIAEGARMTEADLTTTEFQQSKELASWLWNHRCTRE
jgi:hypothetical protein